MLWWVLIGLGGGTARRECVRKRSSSCIGWVVDARFMRRVAATCEPAQGNHKNYETLNSLLAMP
jgi:hypothetical protein